MEDLPLNLAHREDRKADRHLQCGQFDDAVNSHLQAAKFLEDAMTNTCIPQALQSLQLQKAYHLRQLQIISLKKAQLKALKSAFESKLKIMAHINPELDEDSRDQEPSTLQTAIYRTMEEADSLIIQLVQTGDEFRNSSKVGNTVNNLSQPSFCHGSKKPKEAQVVIEELHTLNQQLRLLVERLVTELSVYEHENTELKKRLKELEYEHKNCDHYKFEKADAKVSSRVSSPPYNQRNSDVKEVQEKCQLPALAPLEMPKFDYTWLTSSESVENID